MSTVLGLAPAGVAGAWVPLRGDLPNTDVAMLLVLCVGVVAMAGGRWAAVTGALVAAATFDFFDTPPYGQFFMTRASDVVTTFVLVGAAIVVGELAVRARSYHRMAANRGEDFTVMSGAARLMAVGENASLVVGALAGELVSRVGLLDCEFQYGPPTGDRPYISRSGKLVYVPGSPPGPEVAEIDLPVWSGADVVGRYRLSVPLGTPPAPDRLLAAVGIAEQAGAALAGHHLSSPRAPERPRRLRLLR